MGRRDPVIEVEAKAPAGAHTVDRLEALGERGTPERHIDVYLQHPGRSFEETDEALRLRAVDGRVELTYKGPKLHGRGKTRRELTVTVNDLETATAILAELGFRGVAEVRKRRTPYQVGDWLAVLDEVEGVGLYVEVERELPEGSETEAATEEALALLERLEAGPPERRSYLELLLERRGRAGE